MSRAKFLGALGTLLLAAVVLQASLGHAVPLRESFERFPRRLGAWVGSNEAPDPEALARARPDEYLSRRYGDAAGRPVVLYVAYFARESSRAQVQAVCWGSCQVRDVKPHRVRLGPSALEVNRAWVVQDGEPAVVLYWYQLGHTTLRDPYRAKLDQALRALLGRRSDGALVRVSAPVRGEPEEALARAEGFLRAALPELLRYLPE